MHLRKGEHTLQISMSASLATRVQGEPQEQPAVQAAHTPGHHFVTTMERVGKTSDGGIYDPLARA